LLQELKARPVDAIIVAGYPTLLALADEVIE
jgi:hypothetical protein